MEQILVKLEKIEAKVHSLRKTCKQNKIGISFLNGFNIKKMREIYSRLQKHYQQNPEKGKALWFQSQLKLFNWVLISHSLVNCRRIENFNQQDWLLLKRIFPGKDIYTFKFESKKLLHKNSKNQRLWNSEEDQILTTIMQNPSIKNRWSQVARMFYELSNQKFFRTGKQCREHWLNHLDPSKKHGKWTHQEDLIILKYVILSGKKWSTISKQELPHRTQHMIKNRFKSLLSRFQKVHQLSEDNENLCIRMMIDKIEKRNNEDYPSQDQVKDEEIEMSEENESNYSFQAEVKIEKAPEIKQNLIVSEVKKLKSLKTNEDLQAEEVHTSSAFATTPSMVGSQHSFSPTILSIYYQPSFICFPIGSCWNLFSGYVDIPVTHEK